MKEYRFTITHNGQRAVYRQFGWSKGSATQALKADIGYFSIVRIEELA